MLAADGAITILIGLLMVFVAFRVGYDNMVGLIGVAAPKEVENKMADMLLADPDVVDIYKMRIIQEGRVYHIDGIVELRKGLSLAQADDIKFESWTGCSGNQKLQTLHLALLKMMIKKVGRECPSRHDLFQKMIDHSTVCC